MKTIHAKNAGDLVLISVYDSPFMIFFNCMKI